MAKAKSKRPVGRPTTLTKEHIKGAESYLKGGFQQCGDVVPSIAGLACFLGVHKGQLYSWSTQNQEFHDMLEAIKGAQEKLLINGGLLGDFNATITKLMLSKHGYSEKVENNHTSSDGSMTPKANTIISAEEFAVIAKELDAEI